MYIARSIPAAIRGRGCDQAAFVAGDGVHTETTHNILDLPKVSKSPVRRNASPGAAKKKVKGE